MELNPEVDQPNKKEGSRWVVQFNMGVDADGRKRPPKCFYIKESEKQKAYQNYNKYAEVLASDN